MANLSHIQTALIVEDNYMLAIERQDFLVSLGCRNAVRASQLEKALVALNVGVEFAVLDVSLADGPCADVANKFIMASVPFIFVSGYQRSDHPDLPDAPWVTKPATETQLLAAVGEAMQRWSDQFDLSSTD